MKPAAVPHNELSNLRETVESIWIAIILAFVLRAFVIEAFVIPTGSMAPRLMGQHVLAHCPECGYEFPVSRSEISGTPSRSRFLAPCPNCRQPVDPAPAINAGDRVLVLKYLYDFRQPRRWDVVVFKDPQSNELNYIKRLAGLPGEAMRIIHGDVFVHPIEDADHNGVRDENDLVAKDASGRNDLTKLTDWQLARKGHDVQEAMWQIVSDNDYRSPVKSTNAPLWRAEKSASGWDLQADQGRVFRFEGSGFQQLRFAQDMDEEFLPSNGFYNVQSSEMPISRADMCSDLKLETTVMPQSPAGLVRLSLSSFEHEFAAEFNFDGRIRLLHRTRPAQNWSAAQVWGEKKLAPWKENHAVHIALTHTDWQATVWLNGVPVLETDDSQYHPDVPQLIQRIAQLQVPPPRVGVAAADATCELWHTRVWRDVFYLSPTLYEAPRGVPGHYALAFGFVDPNDRMAAGWGTTANPIALRAYAGRAELDEFFMLGDNSPASKDSRLWVDAAPSLRLTQRRPDGTTEPLYRLGTVPRYNLIGRAFFVYWPAGGKLVKPDRLPYVPNVGKMRRIR